ncbi:ATP-binding protein [Thiofilum flexile]|uniref:ATP-binding protein n=1 Tax=Thiofilum flexile TaxID=125627 RepID=UPI000369AECE|nr:DUF499 domain-containing protein [Thiofilum flexile]
MSLKPWREIARPHKDILEGKFAESEFAADITQVAQNKGSGSDEYRDAQQFFARTYITEGMRLLLISVAKRLAGQGGDPVIQLQTAFGGGKTHTMLAVYHLASRSVSPHLLEGIPPILDQAGIHELPRAKVAVIDGINISPSEAQIKKNHKHEQKVTTLWGELAWQLLGDDGLAMVQAAHETGTSPGKAVLVELLEKAAPCVILVDELTAFLRQFEPGKSYPAGTFDSNLSFIQALTEAVKTVPNAILLASLPESDVEAGGSMGQKALTALEKYFGRVESVWKPVATTEAFEIVRRRLFQHAGEPAEVEGISRQFHDFYRAHSSKFPLETQSNVYFERLCQSYPIHPEIFDRLYEDWSTLEKFQRTRGVLQYLAIVIHRLWNSDNRDALIMPGSLPLDDSNTRNKSLHYLPQGWEPVVEKEVDGVRSEPSNIDGHDTRFGSVQAARRTMRTIFLGSAPTVSHQAIRGLATEHILLGSVQPGQTLGIFEDVLKRLRDRLHYLFADQERFWLDTRPNLRREMESRRQNLSERESVIPLIKEQVNRLLKFSNKYGLAGVHIFTPSSDVPDEYGTGIRLVVLAPPATYSRNEKSAEVAALEVLQKRGEQPRQKQNRLIFLAADHDVFLNLKDQARTYLAWKSIIQDIDEGKLNLDLFQAKQARKNKDSAEQVLTQLTKDTYKWLLCPTQDMTRSKQEIIWEVVAITSNTMNLMAEIESKLRDEEWLITEWSPIHLQKLLKQWYFKDGHTEISVQKVWQDCCHYLFMPRLGNDQVLKDTISKGLTSEDYFAFAAGKNGDKYIGFAFGKPAIVSIDSESLFIEQNAAAAYLAASKPSVVTENVKPYTPESTQSTSKTNTVNLPSDTTPTVSSKKTFYGSIQIDPLTAKMKFAQIIEEVVEQFTTRPNTQLNIVVEIRADSPNGFDTALQQTIKENCNTLKFDTNEFDDS